LIIIDLNPLDENLEMHYFFIFCILRISFTSLFEVRHLFRCLWVSLPNYRSSACII